jgi:protein involved in sex pheromone biosynthesis
MKVLSLAVLLATLMLAGCSPHLNCSEVRQDRVNGMTSEQIAAQLGVSTSKVDDCY